MTTVKRIQRFENNCMFTKLDHGLRSPVRHHRRTVVGTIKTGNQSISEAGLVPLCKPNDSIVQPEMGLCSTAGLDAAASYF